MAVGHGGQVLISQATASLIDGSLPPGVELRDLGQHRLRDLARPERIHQVTHPELAVDFPALRSLDAYPTNLPLQVSSFFGREEDLATLTKVLGESRLVTITGVGGVGKTRVALQVAAEVLPSYEDGAWFCELALLADPDELEPVVAAALGVAPRNGLSLSESIVEFLRMKRLLLVLDNCEHVLDAAAGFVESALAASPGLRVLATSREGLAIAGEQVRPLRPLPTPGAAAEVEVIATTDSVAMFTERAQAARPDFVVDASNAGAVAEICRRVDGIPLAIELAAARVASMGPAQIAERLDERFRLLTGSRRRSVERHQTLRSTLEWSYSLLGPRDRAVFDRLGVFAGSFDVDAAQAVAAGEDIEEWDVLDALGELVAKSMLVAEPTDDGTVRYALLETLRHYALDQLADHGDLDSARHRHGQHYARLAEEIGPWLIGPMEDACRARIEREVDNLRAAVGFGLDGAAGDGARHEPALRIVGAFALEVTLYRMIEVGEWARRALPVLDAAPPHLRSAVRAAAGWRAYEMGDGDAATGLGVRALEDHPAVDEPAFVMSHALLAVQAATGGDLGRSIEITRDALALVGPAENALHATASFHTLIAVYLGLYGGDADVARGEAERALAIARIQRSPITEALALYALSAALHQQDPAASLAAAEESLTLVGRNALFYQSALHDATVLRVVLGDVRGAIGPLRELVVNVDQQGDLPQLCSTVPVAALVFAATGRDDAAIACAALLEDGPFSGRWGLIHESIAADYETALAGSRAQLGSAASSAAAARGAAMDYHEAVAFLLAELETAAEM
jgi:predicted ATPase